MTKPATPCTVAVIGSAEFGRRVAALLAPLPSVSALVSNYGTAWADIISEHPNVLIIDIGPQHNDRLHAWMRSFLAQVRERFNHDIYIAVALTAPEKFGYGGDLLFESAESTRPSQTIDTLIATPPSNVATVAPFEEQIRTLIPLIQIEIERRISGQVPLPPLGADGWVQTLVDPSSRDLWMSWVPRYASYTDESPIIIGETGTGKTRLAYALHLLSGRPGKFVSITPRDFSSSELVQAELFGAVSGAYTGAVDKWGLVKSAEKGTLFIDELQSIDKDLQGKLITFIENKSYRRVGSAESVEADVRFVFASNRSLYDMMQQDVLRDDFAYRLERVQLELLPLEERRLDIAGSLAFALAKIKRQRPKALPVLGLTAGAYRMLFCNQWPGNLRQLENTTARFCEYADMQQESLISEANVASVLKSKLSGTPASSAEVLARASYNLAALSLTAHVTTLESGLFELARLARSSALEATAGDIDQAAALISDDARLIELSVREHRSQRERGAKQ